MKARRPKTKHPHALNELLNRRILSYAAAAAGAGMLGLSLPAEAQIVYTPAHVVIGYNSGYALDLANNGATDFIIHGATSANCSTFFSDLLAKPARGNAMVAGAFGSENFARAMAPGAAIGPGNRFASSGLNGGIVMGEAISSPGGGQLRGSWVHALNRYLGLRFQINGQTHYGWARLTAKISLHTRMQVVLTGYAFEVQPDTPIVAGQEHGQSLGNEPISEAGPGPGAFRVAPAEPASLAMLALGAPGLALWRRDGPAARSESPGS